MLSGMIDLVDHLGTTRGSALYTDELGEKREGLEECFRFRPETEFSGNQIQEIRYRDDTFPCTWRSVRPIPEKDDFFENVWAGYRKNHNIY